MFGLSHPKTLTLEANKYLVQEWVNRFFSQLNFFFKSCLLDSSDNLVGFCYVFCSVEERERAYSH
jgi:hypothetical protein